MKVIICGAGQVGFSIAQQLSQEQNSVTVIDQSAELIAHIEQALDVKSIVGHASHPDLLDRAGAGDADMLIAVTFSDEVNMVAAQIAHSVFSVPLKIARVRTRSYLDPVWQGLFSRNHMPIDVIISPEVGVGTKVLQTLSNPGAFETVSFADEAVKLVGVHLAKDCPIVNTPLSQLTELFPDLNAFVVGIARGNDVFVPKRSDQMLYGDDVYFIAHAKHVRRTLDIFGREEREAHRIILIGGGNIGLHVAQQLEKESDVKVRMIERDKLRAEIAADELKRTVVFHGDGLDQDLLQEAGIKDTEAVVALTDDDETNVLASVLAKRAGALRGMCLINSQKYGPLLEPLGIDTFIDPRATTVSTILQHVRRGRIKGLHSIRQGAAEVIEAEALATSPLVGKPLRESHLPDEGMIVGAVVRKGKFIRPGGDTKIEIGDRVVIFVLRDMVRKVEQLFRVSLDYF